MYSCKVCGNSAVPTCRSCEEVPDVFYDYPKLDGTDFAHPAYWRGEDHAIKVFCEKINKILDGKEPTGCCNEPWESVQKRLWSLVNHKDL